MARNPCYCADLQNLKGRTVTRTMGGDVCGLDGRMALTGVIRMHTIQCAFVV